MCIITVRRNVHEGVGVIWQLSAFGLEVILVVESTERHIDLGLEGLELVGTIPKGHSTFREHAEEVGEVLDLCCSLVGLGGLCDLVDGGGNGTKRQLKL